jgi:hypothetical protein
MVDSSEGCLSEDWGKSRVSEMLWNYVTERVAAVCHEALRSMELPSTLELWCVLFFCVSFTEENITRMILKEHRS